MAIGLINEVIPWVMPLWQQALIGAGIITLLEFCTGCLINLWLGWGIWDYSRIPVALAGILPDDWLRHEWFGEAIK